MKLAFLLCLLAMGGCASVPIVVPTPTTVDPAVNVMANDIMAVTAAYAGDCNVAPDTTAPDVAKSCAPVNDSTSDLQNTANTVQGCFRASAGSVLSKRVSAAATGLIAQICAGGVVVPIPMAQPGKKP